MDAGELLALSEGFCANTPYAGGQLYLLDAAFSERSDAYFLEALRELHAAQVLAVGESPRFDGLQHRRNSDVLQPTALEAILPEVLQSIWEPNRLQILAFRERAVLDPSQRGRELHVPQSALLKDTGVSPTIWHELVFSEYL